MLPDGPQKHLVERVSVLLHADKYFDAAEEVRALYAKTSGARGKAIVNKSDADEYLTILLHWCLNNEGFEEAAQLLWGPTLFDPRPESTQRVWKAFQEHNFYLLMGAASMSKSYSIGVRLMLEWIRDPEWTNVKVIGPSEQHLEDNLFSHLVALHRGATIPLPGTVGKLWIGLDPRSRKGAIVGVVVPLGRKAAGRIQGSKRVNRKKPHPVFGKLSRMFIFLDEIANIPVGIWRDIDNAIASGQGDDGLKIGGAFNPTDQQDEVGKRCEPPKGWQMFDPDEDFEWESSRGWYVVRLDAAQSENVKSKKVIYSGLQTYEGFQMLIKNSGGMDSPGYWSMGRGCFPPMGIAMSIIPAGMLSELRAEVIWYDRPQPCGAVDLALLGDDTARFAKGLFGQATGVKMPPNLQYPDGRVIMFKGPTGQPALKSILLIEAILKLPKGDTVAMKDEIKRVARAAQIRPEWLCVDRTGNGQGVYDLLRYEFGPVIGVNYSQSATDTKIMIEDQDVAKNLYDRVQSELWFAARKFIEFGYCKIGAGLESDRLFPQLTGRLFKASGSKTKVEDKPTYKSRNNNESPDEADAFTLIIHCVRKAAGFIPGMTAEESTMDQDGDEYYGGSDVRVDESNRFEDL